MAISELDTVSMVLTLKERIMANKLCINLATTVAILVFASAAFGQQGNTEPQTAFQNQEQQFGQGLVEIDNEVNPDARRQSQEGNAAAGGQGNPQIQALQQLFGGGAGRGAGATQNQLQRTRVVRAPFRVRFSIPNQTQVMQVKRNAAATRFVALPRFQNASVSAALSNRVLTLNGTVRTQEQRRLAERVAKLEPGVSRVNNMITVLGN